MDGSVSIVSPEALHDLLEKQAVVLLDVRVGSEAEARYDSGHLIGAIHVDLERDLTGDSSNPATGGRHPLPPIGKFVSQMGEWGITPDRAVIVYDDEGGALAAARAWWMIRAAGHSRCAVLDGGLQGARDAGLTIVEGRSERSRRKRPEPPYPIKSAEASGWGLNTVDMKGVNRISTSEGGILIDVRAPERYRGEEEPLDPVAGHIPGAVSVPLSNNLDENGRFKAPKELRKMYLQVLGEVPPEKVVISCGSGVTACHTLLALEHAGLQGASLYVGSFSEWCRSGKPVDTGAGGDPR